MLAIYATTIKNSILFYYQRSNKINTTANHLIVDALEDELYVPVHVIQIDDATKVVVERDAKFLNVDGAEEAALPVQLDAGSFVYVLQEADVDSGNNVFNGVRFGEDGGVVIVDAVIVVIDCDKNVVCGANGDERF